MSLREEQCKKVCRILDNVLANRPTERDSLIVAVRKAFAEPEHKTGYWVWADGLRCSECGYKLMQTSVPQICPHCHSNNGGGA